MGDCGPPVMSCVSIVKQVWHSAELHYTQWADKQNVWHTGQAISLALPLWHQRSCQPTLMTSICTHLHCVHLPTVYVILSIVIFFFFFLQTHKKHFKNTLFLFGPFSLSCPPPCLQIFTKLKNTAQLKDSGLSHNAAHTFGSSLTSKTNICPFSRAWLKHPGISEFTHSHTHNSVT